MLNRNMKEKAHRSPPPIICLDAALQGVLVRVTAFLSETWQALLASLIPMPVWAFLSIEIHTLAHYY